MAHSATRRSGAAAESAAMCAFARSQHVAGIVGLNSLLDGGATVATI